MTALFLVARVIVVFEAAAGFLFGQIFCGVYSATATVTGIAGIMTGIMSIWANQRILRVLITLGCFVILAGVILNIKQYVSQEHSPGNAYPWGATGLFLASALTTGVSAWMNEVKAKSPRSENESRGK